MKIIALDPSSTCTGYAVFINGGLIEHGRLKPNSARHEANVRIDAMILSLSEVCAEHDPDVIVIEDTSGKVGHRHGGAGAGLAIHGKAVGEFRRVCISECRRARVVMVLENDWTRGVPKEKRRTRVAMMFPAYRSTSASDKGGDAADAIGLGDFYWQRFGRNESKVAG